MRQRLVGWFSVALAAAFGAVAPPASAQGSAAPAAGKPAARQVLAVLDVASRLEGEDAKAVDPAKLAQTVRAAAAAALPDLAVLGRPEMLKALAARPAPAGVECKESCEALAGRRIGADLVISAVLVRGEKYTLDLSLHDVRTLATLGTEKVAVKAVKNLDGNLPRLTGLLLARLGKKADDPAAPPAPPLVAASAPPVAPPAPVEPAPRVPLTSSRPPPEVAPLPAQLLPTAQVPVDTSPDALVARDTALAADEGGKARPAEAEKAWRAVADAPGVNPFKQAAQLRVRQWGEFRAARDAFDKQRSEDRASILKVLPLRSVNDALKADMLLRYAKLYSVAEARELLPGIDQAAARASAEALLGCEAKDAQACWQGAQVAAEAGDKPRRFSFLDKACALSLAEACEEVGVALAQGEGVGKDPARSAAVLKQACEAGRGRACSWLATVSVVGNEGTPDPALLEKGCVAGDGQSCMRLGLMTEGGKGVKADEARALTFFRLGCKFHNAGACSKFNYYQQRAEADAEAQRRQEEALRARKAAVESARQAEAASRGSRRVVAGVLVGLGLAAGVGAGAFAFLGNAKNDEVRTGKYATAAEIQAVIDSGKTMNLAAIGTAGLGAALVATGAVLFILNPSADAKDPKVAVLPGGLLISARFP